MVYVYFTKENMIFEVTDLSQKYIHTDKKTNKAVLSSSIREKLYNKINRKFKLNVSGRGMIVCPQNKHFCKSCGQIVDGLNSRIRCEKHKKS